MLLANIFLHFQIISLSLKEEKKVNSDTIEEYGRPQFGSRPTVPLGTEGRKSVLLIPTLYESYKSSSFEILYYTYRAGGFAVIFMAEY